MRPPSVNEVNENLIPEAVAETPVPEVNISPTEKRSTTRRSRIHDKEDGEEEEGELFTRRTKNVLQAISTKIRSNEENKVFNFC